MFLVSSRKMAKRVLNFMRRMNWYFFTGADLLCPDIHWYIHFLILQFIQNRFQQLSLRASRCVRKYRLVYRHWVIKISEAHVFIIISSRRKVMKMQTFFLEDKSCTQGDSLCVLCSW